MAPVQFAQGPAPRAPTIGIVSMTYSDDFRWRAVALIHVYNVPIVHVSELLGPRLRSIRRWYALFLRDGIINEKREQKERHTKWPPEVLRFVEAYVDGHPTFYIEELRDSITKHFPLLKTVSTSTICRALNFDLNLSRKVLSKTAREAVPAEISIYKEKLLPLYSYAERMLCTRRCCTPSSETQETCERNSGRPRSESLQPWNELHTFPDIRSSSFWSRLGPSISIASDRH